LDGEEAHVTSTLHLDWKQITAEAIDELREALEPFGIVIRDDPDCEGTDTWGLIFEQETEHE
jgi:hypothetical protein